MVNQSDIEDALLKRALGYDVTEVVEEYSQSEDDLKMTKRKVTSKNVPPDISAAKLLLEIYGRVDKDISALTDEELEAEKERLLKLLKESENDDSKK